MKKHYFIISLLIGLACLCSCNDDSEVEFEKASAEQTEMLENYADNFIIPAFEQTKISLDAFSSELNSTDGNDLSQLKALFETLYLDWQSSNFYNFGPANTYSLENHFNIYPTDTTQVNANLTLDLEDVTLASDEKGLPAVDYILYTNDTLSSNHISYLRILVEDMNTRLTNTIADWKSSYRDAFVVNGGYSTGSATSFILNSFIQYFERNSRDGKLGIPLGIRSNGDKLPEKSEAYYSGLSNTLLEKNISALNDFFNGGTGYGLDDLLKSSDSSLEEDDLEEINELWGTLETKAGTVSEPIANYVINNEEEADDFYELIQEQLVNLKIDVISALGVKITYSDTDGD